MTNRNEETRTLPVELTEGEKLELGNRIALLEMEVEKIEGEKKEINDVYNSDIKAKNIEILETARSIYRGTREVGVSCYWADNDPEDGKKTLYRVDTAEAVEIQDMNLFDGNNHPEEEENTVREQEEC